MFNKTKKNIEEKNVDPKDYFVLDIQKKIIYL